MSWVTEHDRADVDLADLSPARRPARGRALAAVSVVALLCGALLALVSRDASPPTAATRLARLQSQVATADTVRIVGTETWSSTAYEGGAVVEDEREPVTVHIATEHRFPDSPGDFPSGEFSARYESDNRRIEVVLDGSIVSSREDDKADELPFGQWTQDAVTNIDLDAPPVSIREGRGVAPLLTPGFTAGPECGTVIPELVKLVEDLTDPEETPGGGLRVTWTLQELIWRLTPDDEARQPVAGLDGTVTFDLTPSADGGLDRLVVRIDEHHPEVDGKSSEVHSEIDLRFTGWDGPVEIGSPEPGDVDPTPHLEEEAVSTAGFQTWAPSALPDRFELVRADAEPARPSGSCASVYTRYADPAADAAHAADGDVLTRSIDIVQSPAGCTGLSAADSLAPQVDRATATRAPFVAGEHRGTVIRYDDPDYGTTLLIELVIGETRLTVLTDVSEADAVAALASLGPLDLTSR